MKFKFPCFVLLLLIALYSCSNDQFIEEPKPENKQILKEILADSDLNILKNTYGISESMLNTEHMFDISNEYLTIKVVSIEKNSRKSGNLFCYIQNGKPCGFIYEDLSEILESDKNSGNTYLYNSSGLFVSFNFEKSTDNLKSGKIDITKYKISYIADNKLKAGFLDCTAQVYKRAKDACDSDSRCKLMCDAADLFGGQCTGSMLIAAAATCMGDSGGPLVV